MIDESQDLESIARMLKQEREELIVAWEQLESEQRQLALTGGNARPAVSSEQPEAELAAPPELAAATAVAATAPAPQAVLPSPNSIVRTVSAATRRSAASNTFRFLQREFDKPDERSST